jgi:AcrR family transcriptional regulator
MVHLMARDDSSQETRQRIVDAVAALVTEEHPATISVPAVARRAGVSVATVYRYFPNKGQLLDAATEVGHRRTSAEFAGRRLDAVVELLVSSATFLELHDHLGLDAGDAAAHVSWAVRTLLEASR